MTTKQPTILLAEDDRFISRAYADGLGRAGFTVVLATDGNEALQKMKASRPDLLLLDLIMPLKSGFEVMEAMRADQELKTIPVIVLSNLGQESDMAQAKTLGVVDYCIKSNFSMKQVIEKVKSHLSNQHT